MTGKLGNLIDMWPVVTLAYPYSKLQINKFNRRSVASASFLRQLMDYCFLRRVFFLVAFFTFSRPFFSLSPSCARSSML